MPLRDFGDSMVHSPQRAEPCCAALGHSIFGALVNAIAQRAHAWLAGISVAGQLTNTLQRLRRCGDRDTLKAPHRDQIIIARDDQIDPNSGGQHGTWSSSGSRHTGCGNGGGLTRSTVSI